MSLKIACHGNVTPQLWAICQRREDFLRNEHHLAKQESLKSVMMHWPTPTTAMMLLQKKSTPMGGLKLK
jgi:hypothetical protein